MSCVVEYRKYVKKQIDALHALEKEGVEFTANGTDVSKLLGRFRSAYSQVGKDNIEVLEGVVEQERDIAFTVVRANLKEVFKGSIGSGYTMNKSANTELSLVDVTMKGDTFVLQVKPTKQDTVWTFTFKRGSNVSNITEGGKRLYVPYIDIALDKARKQVNDIDRGVNREEDLRIGKQAIDEARAYLRGNDKVLGSAAKTYSSRYRGEKRTGYLHGDVDSMKEILRELYITGNNKADPEYMKYAEGLMDGMSPSFFREMTLYVNESTSTTAGWTVLDKGILDIRKGKKRRGNKSEAEVYLHEVVHTMTAWALESGSNKAGAMRSKLNYIMKKARENTKWEDLLGKDVANATKQEIKDAKDKFEYVFNDENANHEFIAHVLTDPAVMKHMSTLEIERTDNTPVTLLEKALSWFYKVMDLILGNYKFYHVDKDIHAKVHTLAFQLAEINQEAEGIAEDGNIFKQANRWIDETELKLSEKLEEYVGGNKEDYKPLGKLPENASGIEQALYAMKFFGKSLVNGHYRKASGLYFSALGLQPEGSIRGVVSDLFTPDGVNRMVEWLGLKNGNIDTLRSTVISQTMRHVIDGFENPLSEDDGAALTRGLMDTNLSQLMFTNPGSISKIVYSKEDLLRVMTSKSELDKQINKANTRLENILDNIGQSSEKNWVKKQAQGLGYYMGTHRGTPVQNLNAENIARGYISKTRRRLDQNLVEAINEVAVLNGLKYTDKKYVEDTAGLIAKDWEGVKKFAGMYEAFKRESREGSFKKDQMHMISGYSKELFDDTTEVKYADMSMREELEDAGYKFISEVKPMYGESRSISVGMFVSDMYGKTERLRGAVNLGDAKSKGINLKDIKFMEDAELGRARFENDMMRINKNASKLMEDMYSDTPIDFDKVEMGLVPVLNVSGNIVSYRYMSVNKKMKQERMGQNINGVEVIARSMGALVDKQLRENHNKDVLEVVKTMMKSDVWDGGELGGPEGLTEYRIIGPNVEDEQLKELYYMLPQSFKDYANGRKNKVIAVPAELMGELFGYQHAQMGDLLPRGVLPKGMRNVIRRLLNMFEAYWMDLVKIAKGNILLKMPMVLVSNIVSNTIYMWNTGVTPAEIWRLHRDSIRDVKAFMQAHKEVASLKLEIGRDRALLSSVKDRKAVEASIKNKVDRVARLEKEMKGNAVYELVEAGMYQSVVEDVETSRLNDTNKISVGMDKLLSKVPKIVKIGAQVAYLSQETKWYQFNQEVLQLSDLVARDVMNRKQKRVEKEMADGKLTMPKALRDELGGVQKGRVLTGETRKKFMELSKKARLNNLLDVFINYNKPNGKWEEWMNRVGLLMFTKYIKRIQRVVFQTAAKHPIRSLMLIVAAGLAVDVDMIQDQAYIARGFGFGGDWSPANIVPVYDPAGTLMNVITPAILKPEMVMGLI